MRPLVLKPEFSDSPIGGEHGDFETITDKLFSDNLENLNDKNRNTGVYDTEYCTIPELNLETVKLLKMRCSQTP